MIKFNDLPPEIQQHMLDEQVRQGNPRNTKVFEKTITACSSEGGFTWEQSKERFDFWYRIIINGNLAVFYEKYPKKSNEKLYTEEEVRDLFIKHCKDLYNTNEEFYELLLNQDLKWFEDNKK